MPVEVEWRFLVTRLPALPGHVEHAELVQFYLNASPPAVRVRIVGSEAFLTIKGEPQGSTNAGPAQRQEFEYPIPVDDARELAKMASLAVSKTRYWLPSGIELDVFSGSLAGLVIAEAEVEGPHTPPPAPPDGWEWTDISSDRRYTNRALASSGMPAGTPLARIG